MKFFSNFHPAALMLYFLGVLLAAMFSGNPVILILALLGGGSFAWLLSEPRERREDLGFYLGLLVLVTLTNPLFSHNGVTPLFFLNGNPVTLEAIAYGFFTGLTVVSVILWCKCYNKVMSTDKFLYLFGRVIPSLSLVLSMALRYVPMLKRQAGKVERAQKTMGLYASDSRFDRIRSKLMVFSSLVGWSLENAVEVSRSMRARGYGLSGHTSYSNYHFTGRDLLLLGATILAMGLYFGTSVLDLGRFSFYPAITALDTRPLALVQYIAFGLLSMAPALIETEETLRWNYSRSKI